MKSRSAREKWSVRKSELAVSIAISASWHFFVLAILAMAVHPLQLPDSNRPIDLELLPPLPPIRIEPPPPPIPPKPILRKLIEIRPPPPVPPKPVDVQPAPEPVPPQPAAPKPLEVHPPQPILRKPIEVERPPSPALSKPLQASAPSLSITPVPQEPLTVARPPQPALPRPLEIERPALVPPRSIVTERPAPPAPSAPAPSASTPQNSAAVPVLTNQQVVQAPIEIRPPDRPPAASLGAAPPAFPEMTPAGGGPPSSGAQGGGAQAGGGQAGGRIVGFEGGGGGLRTQRGCLTPETYRLTPEERAACLDRVGAEAQGRRPLGLNIPADKQAEYDRQAACHAANVAAAIPRSNQESDATGKILGLGDNPRLRDCGPGDR